MKGYCMMVLLSVLFVSPYAFAQGDFCPCDDI